MGSESNNARSGKTAAEDVVATVKEIVNCTEQEIYDVLKDCDMDPNLAVEKLLAQGFLFLSFFSFFSLPFLDSVT